MARSAARRTAVLAGAASLALLSTRAAHAQDKAGDASAGDVQPGANEEDSELEFTALPVVGGDSDVGFGGGVITSLAEVAPNVEPFWWRVEAVATATVKLDDDSYQFRYADAYLALSLPHVIRDRLGLSFRISYTKESDLSYYGIGNASSLGGLDQNDPYYSYDWTHPKVMASLEYKLTDEFELLVGASYIKNSLSVPPDGKLAEDSQSELADLRRLTRLEDEYDVALVSGGINWDTRDDEVSPESGHLHGIRVDLAPGGSERVPYRWGRANLQLREYVPLLTHRLVFAGRLTVDALFGQPPFYELARVDDSFAIGGSRGVRGILAPRYYGMLKLLTNFELRLRLFDFDFLDKQNQLWIVGFSDLGRVFADYSSLSELDGSGLGIKTAYGGGIRLRSGKSFVLRAEVAGSKAEGSFSGYLAAGHSF